VLGQHPAPPGRMEAPVLEQQDFHGAVLAAALLPGADGPRRNSWNGNY
jgi:hypothetical protein